MLDLDFIEGKQNWESVFETLTDEELAEIRKTNYDDINQFPEGVSDSKIIEDVTNYFLDFGGDDAPDKDKEGRYAYTRANFLWACNL